MGALAVIDDRPEGRDTVRRALTALAGPGFQVVGIEPLDTPEEYASFVGEEEVEALILDERLGERAREHGAHVQYGGHDVVDVVRQSYPSLPIFVLTAYPDEPGVRERLGAVEDVIDRRAFNTDAKTFVQRIVRAASRYSKERSEALGELGELARKIAEGAASAEEKKRALALQTALDVNIPLERVGARADLLREAEGQLHAIQALRQRLEGRLVHSETRSPEKAIPSPSPKRPRHAGGSTAAAPKRKKAVRAPAKRRRK